MSRRRHSGQMAEASFRRLRDEICLRAGGLPVQSILVASARRGDGRSAVAVGLARAFARSEPGSVVLADFDLLRPSLHRLLGASPEPGISEMLRGTVSLEAALSPVGDGSLLLLPAGAGSEEAGPLLASPAMAQLLSDLRARAKTMVLDCMPMESGTGAQMIAGFADAAVLVVRADRTLERDARGAALRLRAAGANILGVVLNASREPGARGAALPLHAPASEGASAATVEPVSRKLGTP